MFLISKYVIFEILHPRKVMRVNIELFETFWDNDLDKGKIYHFYSCILCLNGKGIFVREENNPNI